MKYSIYNELKANYIEIRNEIEDYVGEFHNLDYLSKIYDGEWRGIGLSNPWGEFTEISNNFPTLKAILESATPSIAFSSINKMSPGTDLKWHNGKRFKGIVKAAHKHYGNWNGTVFDMKSKPKEDYYSIRNHFTIYTPSEDFDKLGLEVRSTGEKFTWKNGECFSFPDWEEHRAWNHSDGTRIAVLFDYLVETK